MSHDTSVQEQLLTEVQQLRAHLAARRVRHGWLRHFVKGLEDDPAVQARVHKIACVYWAINFPVVVVLFFGFPGLWTGLALFVNTVYSLYANFATDYGALSAAQASLQVRDAARTSKGAP